MLSLASSRRSTYWNTSCSAIQLRRGWGPGLGARQAGQGPAVADGDENRALPHWKVEPSGEPVDGAALLNDLRQIFRRYVVLPKGADTALPLWVLHAWTMDAGDVSPLLVLVSPTKRCGKTSVLIVLYFLTPRSELSSNLTAPALFRYIEDVRPTLLIDEADSFVKDNEELRGIRIPVIPKPPPT